MSAQAVQRTDLLSRAWRGYQKIRRPADLWLCLRVLGWLCLVTVLLRWVRLPLLLSWLTPTRMRKKNISARVDKIVSLTDTCLAVWPGRSNGRCLSRSLTLYRLLRESGLPVVVNFGLMPSGKKAVGHCWLSLEDDEDCRPVFENQEPGDRFINMLRHPGQQDSHLRA